MISLLFLSQYEIIVAVNSISYDKIFLNRPTLSPVLNCSSSGYKCKHDIRKAARTISSGFYYD